jgi:hypothetical protein
MENFMTLLPFGEGVHFNGNILETNVCDQFMG